MKASDIMTKDVITIASSATVADAIALMQSRGCRLLIVERDTEEDAYGIVTDTDIACKITAIERDPQQSLVRDIMTKPCIVVNPDLRVEYVLKLFVQNRLLRAPVIRGELLGIISVSDILIKSHCGEQLRQKLPDSDLQTLMQASQTVDPNRASVEHQIQSWDSLEEQLAELSQQQANKVMTAGLEEYFQEFQI